MKALRGFNKEQWAAAGAAALGGILLLFGFAGGAGAASDAPPRGGEMIYERPGQRYLELPSEKFDQYWKKKVFIIQSAAKLPLPVLRPPEPAEEDLPAPLFRPAPSYDAYNRLATPYQ
jgi:hypothetical protein